MNKRKIKNIVNIVFIQKKYDELCYLKIFDKFSILFNNLLLILTDRFTELFFRIV